ncbi:MAG TPA: hypothetical protein VMV03_07830 [Spirochaetia bacterium]|nr:hypothetical protein [Spirochaetia bacterium]
MLRKLAKKAALLALLGALYACGDQSLFMSLRTDVSDVQLTMVSDGQVLTDGKGVPLTVAAQDSTKLKDLEMDVTLTSGAGASVWHNRQPVPALNEQLTIQPPSLPAGQYKMDVVVYSAGEVAQKKSANFFVAAGGWRIAGIKSYPPVITSSGKVLLKADLQYPSGSDPWVRWSWKGKVIQKGSISQGLGKILWTVPADEGVYTITLEMFPVAPTGDSDFSFSSSMSLSTDVYVSMGTRPGRGDLGPDSSYLSLMHMQASLDDAGVGARKAGKTTAISVGSPEIVSTEEGFGYRAAPGSGIALSWLALPMENGSLKPFTIEFGISFDSFSGQNNVFTAASTDGGLTFAISVDPVTHMPQGTLSAAGGSSIVIPWSGLGLTTGQRYFLSLSIIPSAQSITGLWYLNGLLVASRTVPYARTVVGEDGKSVIGGDNGFSGIIDEFGVYFRDGAGRASTDPDQYKRVEQQRYGADLALAEGFEGVYPPVGFGVEGKGTMAPGGVTLPADSALVLPALNVGGGALSFNADVTSDSPKSAVLRLEWDGDNAPALDMPAAIDSGELKFRIGANGKSLVMSSGGSDKSTPIPASVSGSSSLKIRLVNSASAHGPMTVLRVAARREK